MPSGKTDAKKLKRKRKEQKAKEKKNKATAAKAAKAESSSDDEEAADEPQVGFWRPDRPKMQTPEWIKCQQAFQKKWPDACCWQHIAKCKRGEADCSRSHTKVDGFEAWKTAQSWQ